MEKQSPKRKRSIENKVIRSKPVEKNMIFLVDLNILIIISAFFFKDFQFSYFFCSELMKMVIFKGRRQDRLQSSVGKKMAIGTFTHSSQHKWP